MVADRCSYLKPEHSQRRNSIMELYFKDLEDEAGAEGTLTAAQCASDDTTGSCETAEEDAFAELNERVSAARLVY